MSVNSILEKRMKKKNSTKAEALAKKSAGGNLSGVAGIFGSVELNVSEKEHLQEILLEFSKGRENTGKDLDALIAVTSEIKGINNQAALLHGERIKQAQDILKKYQDGAFSAWLIAAYGNRQTPYNFLQYFEFYSQLPSPLRPQIEQMPRQAIYTLASRDGSIKKKVEIVEDYNGQTKDELLRLIRDTFPLAAKDKRRKNHGQTVILLLERACITLSEKRKKITKRQKQTIEELVDSISDLIS